MNRAEIDRLLLRIADGDNDAFAELYLKTKRGVFAFLRTYFSREADVEDAMQTVYLKIKTYIHSYKPHTNGRAWILQIAKNHALNEIKKLGREGLPGEMEKISYGDGIGGEVTDIMERCLSEDERRIITLHVLWGYRHREIADLLECPTGTVTSKYKRAIKKLQDALKEGNGE